MSSSVNDSDMLEVEEMLRTLSTQPSVGRLVAIAHENARLRKENGDLLNENTNTVTLIRRLGDDLDSQKARFEGKHKQLQGVVKDKEALAATLEATEKKLGESEEKAASLRSEFKKRQDEMAINMNENMDELRRLEQFFIPLEPVNDQKEEITSTFTMIYSLARHLANKYHGVDLPPEVLANTDGSLSRTTIELNPTIKIPLLWSKSPLARQMRVAFFLAVLASELCTHIFQPAYVLKDSAALSKVLLALEEEEPYLGGHLRSVLLKAGAELRKMKASKPVDAGEACIDTLVDTTAYNVYNRTCPLVHKDKQAAYLRELQELCKVICKKWRFIQTLEDRFVAEIGSNPATRSDYRWEPLVFEGTKKSTPTIPKPRANGAAPNGNAGSSSKNPAPSPASQSNGIATAELAAGIPVWPVFYNLYDKKTWAEGLILPPALNAAAWEEENALKEAKRALEEKKAPREDKALFISGPSRAARERRRRSSTVPNESQASFLSQSSGGGGKGA